MRITRATITKTWATGAGHAAQTGTIPKITGTLVRIDMRISEVTGDPDVVLLVTDSNSNTLFTSTKDDNTKTVYLARSHKGTQDADFNPIPMVDETVTVSMDPSADAGGSGQTLTVVVDVYLEVE
jgi:hypothetical protein